MSAMTIESVMVRPARPALTVVAPAARTVRLTRRGRLVVFVAVLLGLLALAVLGSQIASAGEHAGVIRTHTVMVKPGDSLWNVAARAAGDGDVTAMEDRIMKLNGLSSDSVQAGQVLRVPA
ncbi:hypothetical protein Back2_11580 [Nocardioides baekrokdamisoli]|uniref:LysM domain-containing protein n=1 Tax=Nocardioides baekrokdamisoli TaxID=1804624 RepID=A0A3G9ITB5_9ACTN|nr:LysM peptidoglycan-binding domain-containing protein [Nocardioides baekrokdamisoli]BBH16871.1 hypothetical protein Back2_11580 [Nocardioides baekrokdamisoli]